MGKGEQERLGQQGLALRVRNACSFNRARGSKLSRSGLTRTYDYLRLLSIIPLYTINSPQLDAHYLGSCVKAKPPPFGDIGDATSHDCFAGPLVS